MSPTSPEPAAGNGREIEWQLASDDLAPVRRWLEAHPMLDGLRIDPLPGQRLRDAYLDSADWQVLRGGFALRRRQEAEHVEATLKSLQSARGDLADRREITEALRDGADEPAQAPGAVGTWLRNVLGDRALHVLFTAQTLRERFAVHCDARQVAEIALDHTSLLGPAEEPLAKLLRVEVEVRDGSPERLAPLVEALSRACRLTPARENKFAAGLRAAGLEPPAG